MIGEPAGLCAFLGLFGSSPLLVLEYYAVVGRSRRATSLIAYLALYFAMMGSIAWLASLQEMLRLKSAKPGSMSPGEFATYSVFLACLVALGIGHIRWLRILRAEWTERLSQDK